VLTDGLAYVLHVEALFLDSAREQATVAYQQSRFTLERRPDPA
jgi:hypothetical protein